jgi:hypothetical protein
MARTWGKPPPPPLIIFSAISHGGCTQMSFCPRTLKLRVPKFSKLGFLAFWKFVIFCANLWLRWGVEQNCNLRWELSNNMWHDTCMNVIQSDFWLLVIRSQIGTLIPNLSFSHNLCYMYSNGSCEPILDIYVSRAFQQYKNFFNPMSFDSPNCSMKVWKSIGTLTPKVGVHLGVCGLIPSHFLTFLEVWMWLSSCNFGSHLSMPLLWLRT